MVKNKLEQKVERLESAETKLAIAFIVGFVMFAVIFWAIYNQESNIIQIKSQLGDFHQVCKNETIKSMGIVLNITSCFGDGACLISSRNISIYQVNETCSWERGE